MTLAEANETPFDAVVHGMGLVLLSVLLSGCLVERSSPPHSAPTERPTASPVPSWPGEAISSPAAHLLASLPEEAGGLTFGGVQVIDRFFTGFHYVDDALAAVDKKRGDAVSVFRYSERPGATIGATTVEGVDAATLLEAFVDTWHAPAIVGRWSRALGGTVGWELTERNGRLTVLYRRANVVYLVSATERATLEAILADMPPPL